MIRPMVGPIINSAGIVLGGVLARVLAKPPSGRVQDRARVLLGVFTVWFGLALTLSNLNGSVGQKFKLLAIVLLAMALGKLAGKLLRLQTLSNAAGQFATRKMAASAAGKPEFNDGFRVATALFCAAPLAILGSVAEGLDPGSFPKVLCVKAAMDGLATMAFSRTFGWGVMVSAIPVLALEGAIIRCVAALQEHALRLHAQPLIDSINATDGLLIFSVALIILQLKKVAVAEYLPSLALAPLLTRWLW
jgi:uncharacterized membrane protein YqgA involved in biofilm formation